MKLLKIKFLSTIVLAALSTTTVAVELDGLMTVEPVVTARVQLVDADGNLLFNPETGEPVYRRRPQYVSGSYFAMGADNPATGVSQESGSAGGITLGTYQPFILSPDAPNPPSGTGYLRTGPSTESTAMKVFNFFGVNTFIGLNPVSYQSGNSKSVPTATVDVNGNLSVDLSSWEVTWNGSAFEQGPRESAASGFLPAIGTYDYETGEYLLKWKARIVGGPFNGVPGYWTLNGTIIADPAIAEARAEPRTIHIHDQGHGFRITISLTDPAGNDISPYDINEGIMISSIGSVDIPEGEITENFAHRKTHGNAVRVLFDDPATGSLQDIIAAVSDVPDGSHVTVCATGKARDADGILRPFEGCSDIAVRTKDEHLK